MYFFIIQLVFIDGKYSSKIILSSLIVIYIIISKTIEWLFMDKYGHLYCKVHQGLSIDRLCYTDSSPPSPHERAKCIGSDRSDIANDHRMNIWTFFEIKKMYFWIEIDSKWNFISIKWHEIIRRGILKFCIFLFVHE